MGPIPLATSPIPSDAPSNAIVKPRRRYSSEHAAKRDFVRQICNEPNFEIVTMSSEDNDFAVVKPTSLAIMTLADGSSTTAAVPMDTASMPPIRRSRYEMPENQITGIAAKIIGDRKELEMHEFMSGKMYGQFFDDDYYYDQHYVVVPNIDPSGDRDSPNSLCK